MIKNVKQTVNSSFCCSTGSDVESITKSLSDIRLERHKQMFKSRYAKKNHCEKGDVVGIRLNRRFDLLMKYREDQLAANRGKM